MPPLPPHTHTHTYTHTTQRADRDLKELLSRSHQMITDDHPRSSTVREMVSNLRSVYAGFQSRYFDRKSLLEGTVEFYHTAEEVSERSTLGSMTLHLSSLLCISCLPFFYVHVRT